MSDIQKKEVYYYQYCDTCIYKNYGEDVESPCDECLTYPYNENSHKPKMYKEGKPNDSKGKTRTGLDASS